MEKATGQEEDRLPAVESQPTEPPQEIREKLGGEERTLDVERTREGSQEPVDELSSNVVDGGPLGGVLDVGLAVDEADAADHVAEAGRAVQPAPAALGTQAEPEDHSQRRPT
ncbi:MAG: hypothetical protein K0Q60_4437 [Microvirga sp.]|nr:hypothetical protein [Microvirga sp.]